MKGFKTYCPLLRLHSYFSIWSIFTSYALTQKESFRSKLSIIRTLGSVTLIPMIILWELNCWLCYGMSYCHCLLIVITFYIWVIDSSLLNSSSFLLTDIFSFFRRRFFVGFAMRERYAWCYFPAGTELYASMFQSLVLFIYALTS